MVTLTQYSMQFLYRIVMEFSHLINIMIKTVHILRVCQSVFESVSLMVQTYSLSVYTRTQSPEPRIHVSSRVNVSSYAFAKLHGQVWTR